MNTLTVELALDILTIIPAENFITASYTNEKDCCCSVGHLARYCTQNPQDYSRTNIARGFQSGCLSILGNTILTYSEKEHGKKIALVEFNDHKVFHFQQDHPKDRVLALFRDMLAKGYG